MPISLPLAPKHAALAVGSAVLMLVCTTMALAERADSDKPTQIEAARGQYDDLNQKGSYEGNVVLTKGTLRIEGARLDFHKDSAGYEYATVEGSAKRPATFRQRRDPTQPGVEELVRGQALRIEYDSKNETVKLLDQAIWQRLENEQLRDEISGKEILYDSRNATYQAFADTQGDGPGRVRTVIAPRTGSAESANPTPPSGVQLQPDTAVGDKTP